MKKNTLFLACCIGLMLFVSCKKDPVAPTINLLAEVGCVTEDAQVYSGNEFLIGFSCTGENLTQIEVVISQDGIILASHTDDFSSQKSDPVSPFTYKHAFTVDAVGTVTIKGTVTDAIGQTASKSFNIHFNEKPNAKFIGNYEGNALFNGTLTATIEGQGEPMPQNINDYEMPITLNITSGEDVNKVIAEWKMNDETMTIEGTVDGDKVSFEVTDFPYTFTYNLGGALLSPTIKMSYAVVGTLVNGQLVLDGTCTGKGEVHLALFNINGTIDLDGTIGGSLTKE